MKENFARAAYYFVNMCWLLGLAVVAVALGAVGFAARKRRQRNLG